MSIRFEKPNYGYKTDDTDRVIVVNGKRMGALWRLSTSENWSIEMSGASACSGYRYTLTAARKAIASVLERES